MFCGAAGLTSYACGSEARLDSHLLRGFRIVDPRLRTVVQRDIAIVDGRIGSEVPASRALPSIDGRGRWLLPLFQDLRVGSWGNITPDDDGRSYQAMHLEALLKTQLYCGVGRVAIADGLEDNNSVYRGLERLRLFGTLAARCKATKRLLKGDVFGHLNRLNVGYRLHSDLARDGGYVQLNYAGGDAVPDDVLASALQFARDERLAAWVVIDDWRKAEKALSLGATVLQGLPSGRPPNELLGQMRERHAYFAPALSFLEVGHMRGPHSVLSHPLCRKLVRPDILARYLKPAGYNTRARYLLHKKHDLLRDAQSCIETLVSGGVRLVVATDAGSCPGAFQGLAVHRFLYWLQHFGVPAWERLAAATLGPATLFPGPPALSPGSLADLLVLRSDPLAHAPHLEIEAVAIGGVWPDREELEPDVLRRRRESS